MESYGDDYQGEHHGEINIGVVNMLLGGSARGREILDWYGICGTKHPYTFGDLDDEVGPTVPGDTGYLYRVVMFLQAVLGERMREIAIYKDEMMVSNSSVSQSPDG